METEQPLSGDFRTEVHGTVFGARADVLHRLNEGDELILVPDAPGIDDPTVWVHAAGGDIVGHVPPSIGSWLAPFMLKGARCRAEVEKLEGDEIASWKRLVIRVRCVAPDARQLLE